MDDLMILKESDLRRILREEIAMMNAPAKEERDYLSIDEAVEYLRSKGYRITKSTLYVHTSKSTIDFHRMGERKIVFTTEQLDQFIKKMKH